MFGLPVAVMAGWMRIGWWLATSTSALVCIAVILALGSRVQLRARARSYGLVCEQCGALLVDLAARASFPDGRCPRCGTLVWEVSADPGSEVRAPPDDLTSQVVSLDRAYSVRWLVGFFVTWGALLVFGLVVALAAGHGRALPQWSLPAAIGSCAVLFTVYKAWAARWRDRAADRAGLRCPWCGSRFSLEGNNNVLLASGNCTRCGRAVVERTAE